jgi:hypothetical protein
MVLGTRPQGTFAVLVVAILADLVSALRSNRAIFSESLTKSDIWLGQWGRAFRLVCMLVALAMAGNAIGCPLVGCEAVH